jgi:hypothetical protein
MDSQLQEIEPRLMKSKLLTGSSWILVSSFLFVIFLILIVWQPLVRDYMALFNPAYPWWMQVDWLLISIFLFMSIAITLRADLRKDIWLVMVAFAGGFFIESWGTHSGLWAYYTGEKPPLWILPAWPIAALCIDRMVSWLPASFRIIPENKSKMIYWPVMIGFLFLLLSFVINHQLQVLHFLAIGLVVILVFLPAEKTTKLLIFLMGSSLGIFLEYWGTSRECWTYYSGEIPPLFAIFAHGMASIAFWQVTIWVQRCWDAVQNQEFWQRNTEIGLK